MHTSAAASTVLESGSLSLQEPSAEQGQHVVVPDRLCSLLPLPGTHRGPRLTPIVRHLQVLAGIPQTASTRTPITDCGYYWSFSAYCAEPALPFCVVCCSLAPPFSTPTPHASRPTSHVPHPTWNRLISTNRTTSDLLDLGSPSSTLCPRSTSEVLCCVWCGSWRRLSKRYLTNPVSPCTPAPLHTPGVCKHACLQRSGRR